MYFFQHDSYTAVLPSYGCPPPNRNTYISIHRVTSEPIEDELVENEPVADEMVVEDELVEGEKAERNLVKAGAAEVEDKKENAVLSWSEQVGETKGFWGPDNQERAQLAQFVTKGTWDRLVEDDEESFSFSFDL